MATCAIWSTTNVSWANASWLWSECSGSEIPPEPPITESIGNYGVDANTLIQPWVLEQPWDAYKELKQKKLIRLICKVKGDSFDEEKRSKKFDVSVKDIKMVLDTVTIVDLTIRE